jgi:hypothetical protein
MAIFNSYVSLPEGTQPGKYRKYALLLVKLVKMGSQIRMEPLELPPKNQVTKGLGNFSNPPQEIAPVVLKQ